MHFVRVKKELKDALKRDIMHLFILLGVPIAYPRWEWLVRIITSGATATIRAACEQLGISEQIWNAYDGICDVLDDILGLWTAEKHKNERNDFFIRYQALALTHSVRITFSSGDVVTPGCIGPLLYRPGKGGSCTQRLTVYGESH